MEIFKTNSLQNIWKTFHFLAQFPFTSKATKKNHYYQEPNVWVALRVAKRVKSWEFMKLENFSRTTEMYGIKGDFLPSWAPKTKISTTVLDNWERTAIRLS